MKIQIISDIHLYFHKDHGNTFIKDLDKNTDILIIAGDIGELNLIEEFLKKLCDNFKHIIYVLGNHEFYGQTRDTVLNRLENLSISNLHWLENKSIVIDNQRFIGTTLWFPDKPNSFFFQDQMNDFQIIKGFRNWVYEINNQARDYLWDTVTKDDIVITHHVPTIQGVSRAFWTNPLTDFYVCELDKLIVEKQPKLWCYGHTHNSFDGLIENTRLICNPFGYLRIEENRSFDWNKVIEI